MWIDGKDIEILLVNMVFKNKNKNKDAFVIVISLICKFWIGCLTFDFN
jgi:hypothetical protein